MPFHIAPSARGTLRSRRSRHDRRAWLALSAAVALVMSTHAAAAQQPPLPRRATRTDAGPVAIPLELLALLRANPNGGEALAAGAADFLKSNPARAAVVVALAKLANPHQKTAIAQGYLRALAALKNADPRWAVAFRAALAQADETFAAIVTALETQNYAEAGGHEATFFSVGASGFSGGYAILVSPQ